MKNWKHNITVLAGFLLTANIFMTMPVTAHAEENTVSVSDAVLLTKYLHGKQSITQDDFIRLDRNHDSIINIFDFVRLKQELISNNPSQELQAGVRLDETNAVNASAWKSALSSQSYIIKSAQELDEIITPLFQAGVIRELEQNYNDTFFENNILFLDLEPLESDSKFTLEISDCAYNTENQLEILYQKNPTDKYSGQRIAIGQVSLPKDQYHENEVVWNMKSHDAKTIDKPIDFTSKSESISYDLRDDASWDEESALITSYEELTEFLGAYLEEERLAEYQELYSEEFFATKSVYLQIDEKYGDSDGSVWRVTESIAKDNTKHIGIDFKKSANYGCEIDLNLHQVIIDKIENNYIVDETEIVLKWNNFAGNVYYYDIPEEYFKKADCYAVAVNIYEFGSQKEIAVYRISPEGMMLYGRHELLESLTYTGDMNYFKSGYEVSADENGNYIEEDFEILFSDESLVVNYTGAENPIEIAWN